MIAAILVTIILLACAIVDYRKQIIPSYFPLAIALAAFTVKGFLLIPAICSALISALMLLIPSAIIEKECFGGGDIKLVAALGFYLGLILTLQYLAVALLISYFISKLFKSTQLTAPLAPYIFIAFAPAIILLAR